MLEGVAAAFAAREAGGEGHAVAGEGGGRNAVLRAGGAEGQQGGGTGDPAVGGDRQGAAGVVVEPGQDLGAGSAGERVVGKSACQHWFGISAANRMQDDFGRLAGSGVTRPWRAR